MNDPAQFYYVWTSLSHYQQKTLVTKFLVDQAIEAPSSFGIIKYGGTVARSMRQMMATGARAAAGRMTSSPLWVGFRIRLASIEHAKPGHIQMLGSSENIALALSKKFKASSEHSLLREALDRIASKIPCNKVYSAYPEQATLRQWESLEIGALELYEAIRLVCFGLSQKSISNR